MRKTVFMVAASVISMIAGTAQLEAQTLYHGFTRLDPEVRAHVEDSWLIVDGTQIIATGSGDLPRTGYENARDMTGLYALPGFIDAHGHITAGPHAIELVDGAPTVTIESRPEITQLHARSALAFGVTTVRNPGGDPVANAEYDQRIASGDWIGPDALHAGAVIQPPPFGGSAFTYPRTEAEWQAEAARQAELGMTYFKLYQTLTEDELATGIRVAHAHGLQAIAHLDAVSWQTAAELGIDGLLHALPTSADLLEPGAREAYLAERGADTRFIYLWFEYADFDGPILQRLFATLAEQQIEVDLTLLVNVISYSPDPISVIFPAGDRPYYHPESVEGTSNFITMSGVGWSEQDYGRAARAFERVLEFARRLHAAGVPLLIGTDGPGGGPLYGDELQLHADAGLDPWEVLRLATTGNAQGLGIADQTGRLAAGYEADIVFLREDPLRHLFNVETVHTVLSNGRAHGFDELTTQAR